MRGRLLFSVLLFTAMGLSTGQAQQEAASGAIQKSPDGDKQETELEQPAKQWRIYGTPATMFFENDDPKKYKYKDIVRWSVYVTNTEGSILEANCFGEDGIYMWISGSGISETKISDLGKVSSSSKIQHPYYNILFSVDGDMKFNIEMTPRDPFHVILEFNSVGGLVLSAIYNEDKIHFMHAIASAKHNVSVDVGGKTYAFPTTGAAEALNKLLYKCKNPDESALYP